MRAYSYDPNDFRMPVQHIDEHREPTPRQALHATLAAIPEPKYPVGSWVRLGNGQVFQVIRADGFGRPAWLRTDQGNADFDDGGVSCRWEPSVGERVLYQPKAEEITVHEYDGQVGSVGLDGIRRWFCVADLRPVLDATCRPVRDMKASLRAQAEPPSYETVAGVVSQAEKFQEHFILPAKHTSFVTKTIGCGKPWHEPGCLCHRGWVREDVPEPRLRLVWATRDASGMWVEAAPDPNRPWLAGHYEHLWCGDGHVRGRGAVVLHPTREGAIAAWREAVGLGR